MMRRGNLPLLGMLLDVVTVNGAYLIALLFVFGGAIPAAEFAHYRAIAILVTILYLGSLYGFGVYDRDYRYAGMDDFLAAARATALAGVLVVAATFYQRTLGYSRLGFAYAFVFAMGLTLAWRGVQRGAHEYGWRQRVSRRRVLVAGSAAEAATVARRLADDHRSGREVVATCALTELTMPALVARYNREPFDELVVVADGADPQALLALHDAAAALDIPCHLVPGAYELLLARAPLRELGDLPLLELAGAARPSRALVKRLNDLTLALPLALLTLPLVLLLALLVRLQSPGPAFFNRPRVGRHGKQFIMYKLRTMVWRPEADLDLTVDGNDPRITGIGRWLRRWSLDELPQLWNVVRGDMALVGPRPEIPAVVATYAPWQHEALEIMPGLTGLSQVSGRDALSLTDKSRLDIFYRRHHTLALDMKILLKTLWVVVSGEGVN